MPQNAEFAEKQRRINEFMDLGGYDAVLLSRSDNFAWFTCGGDVHVNTAQETGVGSLLIHRTGTTLITNNVERGRILEEELGALGFTEDISLWAEDGLPEAVDRVAPNQKIAGDVVLPGISACPEAIARLRWSLTSAEVDRYRSLGADVGAAIGEACMDIEPSMTEFEAAAALASEHYQRGITPIVVLVAADERLLKYRHPLPTMNEITRTVMLVVCGRRNGLIVSATRIVSFGRVSGELRKKHQAVVAVDAAFNAATRIGARIGDVFKTGLDAYAAQGYPEEWKLHHQGGPTGYAPRDYRATLQTDDLVLRNQAFAWNPSIAGTKSEDTVIATPDGLEILSASPAFPMLEASAEGLTLRRSDILVR